MPILVTVVYWILIASPATFSSFYLGWSNVSQHIFNTVFALFEMVLTNAAPPPWIHLPITLVFLGGYVAIAYITHATQGFYPYAFLDPQHSPGEKLAAYIAGIALGQCVVFLIVYGITALRQSLVDNDELKKGAKVLEDDDGVMYYPLHSKDAGLSVS